MNTTVFIEGFQRYWCEDPGTDWESLRNWLGNPQHYENFRVRGISNYKLHSIQIGINQLVDGRVFEEGEKNAAIISRKLAQLNDLEVGDTIELSIPIFDIVHIEGAFDWQEIFDNYIYSRLVEVVEVVGLFETTIEIEASNDGMHQSAAMNLANHMYLPISLVRERR